MANNVERLLTRLQLAQRDLIVAAAAADAMPPDSVIRKIADLEVAIGAMEHLAQSLPEKPPAATVARKGAKVS